jgi:hypothetical protein
MSTELSCVCFQSHTKLAEVQFRLRVMKMKAVESNIKIICGEESVICNIIAKG